MVAAPLHCCACFLPDVHFYVSWIFHQFRIFFYQDLVYSFQALCVYILYSAKPVFEPKLGTILCSSDFLCWNLTTMIFSEPSGFGLIFLTWYPLTSLSDLKEWSPSVIALFVISDFLLTMAALAILYQHSVYSFKAVCVYILYSIKPVLSPN